MQYRGGGVGHGATRAATDFFRWDRHKTDHQSQSEDTEMIGLGDADEQVLEAEELTQVGGEHEAYGTDEEEEVSELEHSETDSSSDEESTDGDEPEEGEGDGMKTRWICWALITFELNVLTL